MFATACWLLLLYTGVETRTKAAAVRPLGGYERLLSRQTPGTRQLSLSHGSAYIVDVTLDGEALVQAIARTMARHPLLRARIVVTDAQPDAPEWAYCDEGVTDLARRIVSNSQAAGSSEQFSTQWRRELDASLNGAQFPEAGPLWRLVHIPAANQSALVFTFNHAIDDQKSVNIVVRDLLHEYGRAQAAQLAESLPFPPSVEEAVAPGESPTGNTLRWALFQLLNALRGPVMIPQLVAENLRADPTKFAALYANPDTRSTFVEPFTLPSSVATGLRAACRARNNTVTSILAAAMLCVTSAAIHNRGREGGVRRGDRDALLRFLLSVDLRPYGADKGSSGSGSDWAGGTVACAAGAVDFNVPVPSAVAAYGSSKATAAFSSLAAEDRVALHENLWNLAARCRNDAAEVIQYAKFVPESVRLFGLGMKYAKVLQVVELDAKSRGSLGRGYSCGVSNMGLVSFAQSGDKIRVREAFYGTSHARNGVLCQLSCMTTGAVEGKEEFCGALQFTDPLITRDQGGEIRRALCDILTEISQS